MRNENECLVKKIKVFFQVVMKYTSKGNYRSKIRKGSNIAILTPIFVFFFLCCTKFAGFGWRSPYT